MKIKKITKEKFEGNVYNFHCLPDENYFSEGILVHNCYKGNTPVGTNMDFDTFKQVFHNLPPTVTQIAYGIGDIDGNPDMKRIFEYTRANGVVPNVTINGWGLTDEWAAWLAKTCGAVAVSLYDRDITYDAIERLSNNGLKQINIHYMISKETLGNLEKLMHDLTRNKDPRLAGLNAIVLLSLKKKGRGVPYTSLSQEAFNSICDAFRFEKIPFGFDSCSAGKVMKWAKERGYWNEYKDMIEPCESTIYSSYINERGNFFPCSFMEGEPGWETGLHVPAAKNFLTDIWQHPKTKSFRERVISCRSRCEGCNHYSI